MRKRFIACLAVISLLSSCAQNKIELRSDIKEFIASFSLQKAMETYVKVHYEERTIHHILEDGVDKKTDTLKIIDFDFSDSHSIEYLEKIVTKENDVLSEEKQEHIITNEDKYYLVSIDNEQELTADEVNNYFVKFFYVTTQNDGRYHSGANYYGDYLTDISYVLQDYVTIDKENSLYIYDYSFENASKTETRKQKYSVNSIGMIVDNYKYACVGEESVEITVALAHI